MGFLDIFNRTPGAGALKKHASRVANKRAQASDRWESILALSSMESAEGVEALLVRFSFRVDPSITDQEEKDAVFQGIIGAGEVAEAPVRQYMAQTESIAWPLKILRRLLSDDQVTDTLLSLLEGMDTEYERDPQKKISVLVDLEERRDERIAEAALPFIEDINETARFHAVAAVLAQEGSASYAARFSEIFLGEESNRVRARILDGFIAQGMTLEGESNALFDKMPTGYSMERQTGKPRRV